jgi:hypothetical protein
MRKQTKRLANLLPYRVAGGSPFGLFSPSKPGSPHPSLTQAVPGRAATAPMEHRTAYHRPDGAMGAAC